MNQKDPVPDDMEICCWVCGLNAEDALEMRKILFPYVMKEITYGWKYTDGKNHCSADSLSMVRKISDALMVRLDGYHTGSSPYERFFCGFAGAFDEHFFFSRTDWPEIFESIRMLRKLYRNPDAGVQRMEYGTLETLKHMYMFAMQRRTDPETASLFLFLEHYVPSDPIRDATVVYDAQRLSGGKETGMLKKYESFCGETAKK